MTSPRDDIKEYNELYHSFTEAYINVHTLTRDFYPEAKKFVERTDPELAMFAEKLAPSIASSGEPMAYQKLVQYINHFDDFTIAANKLFGDLKLVLHRSDEFMTRLLDLKMRLSKTEKENPTQVYVELIPELNELILLLKQIPHRATKLEDKMKNLETDWQKTKQSLQ